MIYAFGRMVLLSALPCIASAEETASSADADGAVSYTKVAFNSNGFSKSKSIGLVKW